MKGDAPGNRAHDGSGKCSFKCILTQRHRQTESFQLSWLNMINLASVLEDANYVYFLL